MRFKLQLRKSSFHLDEVGGRLLVGVVEFCNSIFDLGVHSIFKCGSPSQPSGYHERLEEEASRLQHRHVTRHKEMMFPRMCETSGPHNAVQCSL